MFQIKPGHTTFVYAADLLGGVKRKGSHPSANEEVSEAGGECIGTTMYHLSASSCFVKVR